MSTLDDAIATHLAHGAGACTDPLTDCLAEQCTAPAPLHATRPGWENEPAEPPLPWSGMALVVLLTLLLCALLSACGGNDLWPADDDDKRIGPPDCKNHPEQCR